MLKSAFYFLFATALAAQVVPSQATSTVSISASTVEPPAPCPSCPFKGYFRSYYRRVKGGDSEERPNTLPRGNGQERRAARETPDNNVLSTLETLVGGAQKYVNDIINTFQNNPDESVTVLLTGLDDQLDNTLDFVATALAPLTDGVSKAIANFALSPFVQSIGDGLEVAIGEAAGGVIHFSGAEELFQACGRLIQLCEQYGVDASPVQNCMPQLQQCVTT
ncbi:hypothetical protein TRVA0_002S05138 [Trichomonascus vanleenenianus]|uniref:uncharacterized protein n=1 Tax=Trichomonascus vanleenenianus TaxID=2268995 RepID=UPI003ECB7D8F